MIAHFRVIFFAFLSLALGIWFASLFYSISEWFLYAPLIFLGILLVFFAFHFLFKKCPVCSYIFSIKWLILLVALFMALGFGLFNLTKLITTPNFVPEKDKYYTVYGTIDTNYIVKEKGVYFIASNPTVLMEDAFGEYSNKKLDYSIFVYLQNRQEGVPYDEDELIKILPGNKIAITSTLSLTPFFSNGEVNAFAYKNNYQYSLFVTLDDLTITEGEMGFWDTIREHIRGIYSDNMDPKYAGLAFSVLVGDRTELDQSISDNFQISGIMHVVAVSGLNTAFIMMLLLWVLNKCRANKWVKLAVIILTLTFYAFLCDMTPSVVRSSLMSIFLITAQLFGKQRDDLTSVSLSGLLLLLICPVYIFDLGFLLSYLGIFGIFLLLKPIDRLLTKLKFGKLSTPIALTLSATIMTAPITINAFGYFSLIGLLANLILVPLFGYVFMILFGITLVALILPFVGKLLWLLQWGLWVVDKGAWLFASVPYASVPLKPIPDWATATYYAGAFYSSQQCVAKRRQKVPLALSCFGVFLVGFILSFIF